VLKSVLPSLVSMKANAALAFVLAGVSLWLLRTEGTNDKRRRIAHASAAVVALLGLAALFGIVRGHRGGSTAVGRGRSRKPLLVLAAAGGAEAVRLQQERHGEIGAALSSGFTEAAATRRFVGCLGARDEPRAGRNEG